MDEPLPDQPLRHLTVPTLGTHTRAWQYGEPDADPMILVHGFRGDHHGLQDIARGIAATMPGVRTIVPDLPGFGTTPAVPGREHGLDLYGEWLRAFRDEAAPDGAAILGHSFGSLVVANALSQGLESAATILINPISAPALQGTNALMTKLAIGYYRAAAALPERPARALLGNPVIVRVMSEVMAKTRDPELRSWIHGQHATHFSEFSDSATLLQAFRVSVSHTVADYAESFTMPTLVIAGDRDDIAPLRSQVSLRHRLPAATLRVVPGVGHLVHYEAVTDAVAYTRMFLSETAQR